jgi:hypothetical protein
MATEPLAYVVTDARPWGEMVSAIFRGPQALEYARQWAGEASRIRRIFSENRLKQVQIQREWPF